MEQRLVQRRQREIVDWYGAGIHDGKLIGYLFALRQKLQMVSWLLFFIFLLRKKKKNSNQRKPFPRLTTVMKWLVLIWSKSQNSTRLQKFSYEIYLMNVSLWRDKTPVVLPLCQMPNNKPTRAGVPKPSHVKDSKIDMHEATHHKPRDIVQSYTFKYPYSGVNNSGENDNSKYVKFVTIYCNLKRGTRGILYPILADLEAVDDHH